MPTIVASAILMASLITAFVLTTMRGGLALPSNPADLAQDSGSAAGSAAAAASASLASAAPGTIPSSAAASSGAESPASTPSGAASASPAVLPGPSAPPGSLPAVFAGLAPCPDTSGCYLYRVQPGENLTRLAARFGVTNAALRAANPAITNPSLVRIGQLIRIPAPPG